MKLRLGTAGPKVNHLKKCLRYLRYHISEGSAFDTTVQRAVARFQQEHGLQITGTVDPELQAFINSAIGLEQSSATSVEERKECSPLARIIGVAKLRHPEFVFGIDDGDGFKLGDGAARLEEFCVWWREAFVGNLRYVLSVRDAGLKSHGYYEWLARLDALVYFPPQNADESVVLDALAARVPLITSHFDKPRYRQCAVMVDPSSKDCVIGALRTVALDALGNKRRADRGAELV